MEFSVFRLPKWSNIIQEVDIQLETHLPQAVANYLKSDLRNRGIFAQDGVLKTARRLAWRKQNKLFREHKPSILGHQSHWQIQYLESDP